MFTHSPPSGRRRGPLSRSLAMRRNSFWAQAILSVGPNRRRFALFFAYWVYTLVVLWLVGQIKSARRLIRRHRSSWTVTRSGSVSPTCYLRRSHFKIRFVKEAYEHNDSTKFNVPRSTRETKFTKKSETLDGMVRDENHRNRPKAI